jgi:hypothetical protein
MKLALVGLVMTTGLAHADVDTGTVDRPPPHHVELVGGYAYRTAPLEMSSAQVAVEMGVRMFPRRHLWLAPTIGHGLSTLDTNPERVDLVQMTSAGVAGGGYLDLGPRITAFAGLRADVLYAWGDMSQLGVRGGPQAGVAVTLGQPWGHPMGLEVHGSYYASRMDGPSDTRAGWDAGVFIVGELAPD